LLPNDPERTFIKKGNGFKPVAAQVTRNKSLWIEVKHDRLEQLKRKGPINITMDTSGFLIQ
jgi:hypothetical protein